MILSVETAIENMELNLEIEEVIEETPEEDLEGEENNHDLEEKLDDEIEELEESELNQDIIEPPSITYGILNRSTIEYMKTPSTNIYTENPISYFKYEGSGASGVFTPKIQTFYIREGDKLSNEGSVESKKKEIMNFFDVREIQRAAKMNVRSSHNYIDPRLKEDYDNWALFSFNLIISFLLYDSIGS